MKVANRNLAEITPYAGNAKKHDSTQIANVAESIRQFGFVQPIVISIFLFSSLKKKFEMKGSSQLHRNELRSIAVKCKREVTFVFISFSFRCKHNIHNNYIRKMLYFQVFCHTLLMLFLKSMKNRRALCPPSAINQKTVLYFPRIISITRSLVYLL